MMKKRLSLLLAATLTTATFAADTAPATAPAASPATAAGTLHLTSEGVTLTGSGHTLTKSGAGTITLGASIDIDAIAKTTRKSLVLVEWHYRDENSSREETGQGIVVGKETVMVWGSLISEGVPKEYIKDIKIRLPGKNFTTVGARFLGRTQNRLFAYVKADKPLDAPPLDARATGTVKLGQRVFAVGILDKSGGYETYVGAADVKAIQTRTYAMAATTIFGLTRANAPVFDAGTGALVGITAPSSGEDFLVRTAGGASRIELFDEHQSSSFFPIDEVKDHIANVPTQPFESPRPWAGVGGVSGLEESVRDLYSIPQIAGVTVGSIVPGEAAEKAGLQSRDIVLTIDGKPFSESPVPEVMRAHFSRALDKHKPGDTVKLGVMRDGKKMDITLKLTPSPRVGAELPHVFEARSGIVTRDVNFWDIYNRKLATDTRGVMVALVKNGSPASLGQTPLKGGYIITKVNDTAVENQKQFMSVMKKEADDPEKKELVFVVIQADGESKVCRVELAK